MDRAQTEKVIGEALEIIRLMCEAYAPDFDICTMYVSPKSKCAYILDKDDERDVKYVLNYYEMDDRDCEYHESEDVEDVTDC